MKDKINNDLNNLSIFSWNDNFETGLSTIDEQHKKIVSLLNKLSHTLIESKPLDTQTVFQELVNYAEYHFKCEEKVWQKYFNDDEWFKDHQDAHNKFLPNIDQLKQSPNCTSFEESTAHIIRFLIRWLTFHILGDDKKLASAVLAIDKGESLTDAKKIAIEKMEHSQSIFLETFISMYELLSSRTLEFMKSQSELFEANKKLEELAITDQLTNLYNRRYFETILQREIKRSVREKKSLCVMMIDIDYFKKLNDHYGHTVGDEALKSVSEALKKCCHRPGDYAFRIGGEEFAIVCADTTDSQSFEFSEILRKTIENLKIENKESLVADHVTISIGLTVAVMDERDSIDKIMRRTDTLLYKAKEQGRNRVEAE